MPMKDEAVARVKAFTELRLRAFAEKLIGTDIGKLRPNARMTGLKYREASQRSNLANELMVVAESKGIRRLNDPVIALGINNNALSKLVEQAGEKAAASFDAYVEKLCQKVGPCDSATVHGPLWIASVLTVAKGGNVERWKTQQITNVSRLGTLFNQWPTRKMK